jgi:hypothetical protein
MKINLAGPFFPKPKENEYDQLLKRSNPLLSGSLA